MPPPHRSHVTSQRLAAQVIVLPAAALEPIIHRVKTMNRSLQEIQDNMQTAEAEFKAMQGS